MGGKLAKVFSLLEGHSGQSRNVAVRGGNHAERTGSQEVRGFESRRLHSRARIPLSGPRLMTTWPGAGRSVGLRIRSG